MQIDYHKGVEFSRDVQIQHDHFQHGVEFGRVESGHIVLNMVVLNMGVLRLGVHLPHLGFPIGIGFETFFL